MGSYERVSFGYKPRHSGGIKSFDPPHIACRFCDPFFEAIGVYDEVVIKEYR